MKINIFCIWISHYLVYESKWLGGRVEVHMYICVREEKEGVSFLSLLLSLYTSPPGSHYLALPAWIF